MTNYENAIDLPRQFLLPLTQYLYNSVRVRVFVRTSTNLVLFACNFMIMYQKNIFNCNFIKKNLGPKVGPKVFNNMIKR